MKHGSLFSGIGGFDLAAEWMGWENIFHCEYDPFCQKVLNHHFPNSKLYEDIKTFDATAYTGRIDILTGGFPCQPFSTSGKRLGTEDDRHLWPQMLRIIREVKPRYIVGENVRGIVSWSGGLVFEEVCSDLETEGYEVTPYLLPAAGKNAPHRRDRIWFIAHSNNNRHRTNRGEVKKTDGVQGVDREKMGSRVLDRADISGDALNSNECNDGRTPRQDESESSKERLQERNKIRESIKSSEVFGDASDTFSARCEGERKFSKSTTQKRISDSSDAWENFPTQPPICGGDDGLPKELDGITFPKWRNESIKAYGNAIVPQVVYEIFKAIQKMEDEDLDFEVMTQAH